MCLDLSRPCIPTAALGEEAWKAQTNGSWGLMGIKWGELRNIPLSLGGNPQFSPYNFPSTDTSVSDFRPS